MGMQSGLLYELMSIQQKSVTKDAEFGSEVIAWVDLYGNIRGNTTELNGIEVIKEGMRVMRRRINVTIRYRTGVTTDMRVKLIMGGRILQIVDSIEIPRRRGLVLTCEEFSV